MKVLGLMSGTSLDGIDAVLLSVDGTPDASTWEVLAFHTRSYDAERRDRIRTVIEGGSAAAVCRLHADLGEWLAEAAVACCRVAGVEPADVAAIGSHGQTVWHDPPAEGRRGATLQLGDAGTIAERTGIPVVSDFRTRDVAAGGHGAPLVVWPDRVFFAAEGPRAIQNIGGMGNVTWLPPRSSGGETFAFDTGPGVALIDAAAELATGGAWSFDRDGTLAGRGTVDEALLARLLAHPFFRTAPPRSTGRETFGRQMVRGLARGLEPGRKEEWSDLLATLTALTARSIADAYRSWVLPRGCEEVFLAGGGARNPVLREMIARELAPVPVATLEALGMDPDAREAAAFALMAWAHLEGFPANDPAATGAAGPRVLGSLTPGSREAP